MTKNDENFLKLVEKLDALPKEQAFFIIKGIASNEDFNPNIKIDPEFLNVLIPTISYMEGCYHFLEFEKSKNGIPTEEQFDSIHTSIKKWFDEYCAQLPSDILISINQTKNQKVLISYEGICFASSLFSKVFIRV